MSRDRSSVFFSFFFFPLIIYSKADKQKGVGPSRKQKGGGISIARTYEADADRAGPAYPTAAAGSQLSAAAPEFTPSLGYLRGNAKRATSILKKKAACNQGKGEGGSRSRRGHVVQDGDRGDGRGKRGQKGA